MSRACPPEPRSYRLFFLGVPGVDTWGYGGVYTGAAHTEVQGNTAPNDHSGRAPPFDLSLVGLSLTGESEQAWATRQFPPRVSRA